MTPQIPAYLLVFESTVRPIVAAIALGLVWMGAARTEALPVTRYATASALTVALVAWLALAQRLAAANAYLATPDSPPFVLLGLLIPLIIAFAGVRLSQSVALLVSAMPLSWIVAAQAFRVGGGIFLVLWADGRLPWQFALPAGLAMSRPVALPSSWPCSWRKGARRSQSGLRMEYFRNCLTSPWRLRWGR